jgi:hypothetical protein
VQVVEYFECFEGTNKEAITRKFGVRGINLLALKN